jgi:general secretion pathway protein G
MKTIRLARRADRSAFTLIEMLLVLTIIALLMGMAIYHLVGVDKSAQEQRVQTDLLGLKESLAAYQLETGTLPTTEQGLQALWARPTTEPIPEHWRAMLDEPLLDPWQHPYQYRNPGKHNPDRYDIYSVGPDGQPETDDDIGNWHDAPSTH